MEKSMQRRTSVIVFAMLLTQLLACRSDETSETYVVNGEIVSVVYNGLALRIDHEPIDGYMDAMRMNFRLQSPEDSRGFEPGDRIRFMYVVTPAGAYIRDLERLPPDAELNLEGIPERTSTQDDE
jgi:Cu/Ag efflux protein CusF